MKRLTAAAALALTSCGSSVVPGPVAVHTPYRDIPELVTTTTTVATTTTHTHPPRPKRRVSRERGPVTGDIWHRLAVCESGNRNDGGAPYYGYFQFSAATWRSMGMSGTADMHSYSVQLDAAIRLQARSGWGQWPGCSRKLGLR